jgi:hypothetical protein
LSAYDYFTPAAVADLVAPSDLYSVEYVAQTQDVSGDDLIDVLDIGFSVTGRPGVFTFQFPLVGFRAFESGVDLTSEAEIVNALYEIAV